MPKEKDHRFYVVNLPIKGNYKENISLYKEFFTFLFNHKKPIIYKGDKAGIIRRCTPTDNGQLLWGYISTFTFLNTKDWIDIVTLEKGEVSVPENKFPNLKEMLYVFDPRKHRLLLMTTSVSASLGSVLSYLNKLKEKIRKYEFDVIPETSADAIKEILEADQVLSLHYKITYTNSDVGSDAFEFLDGELKGSNTNVLEITARAERGKSLEIKKSKILQGATELVQEYGEGEASIVKRGKRKKIKTKDYPLILKVRGNISDFTAFLDKIGKSLNHHLNDE